MKLNLIAFAVVGALSTTLLLSGCQSSSSTTQATASIEAQNPLMQPSTLQYQAPDFSQIKDEHFKSALEQGINEH